MANIKVAPKNLNSSEAQEYNEYLKGRAAQGLLSASDKKWVSNYNKNRYELLKGKATQGIKLTPQEQSETDFLINLGVRGFGNPSIGNTDYDISDEEEKRRAGQSAYALLMSEFSQYGLGALVEPLRGFIEEGLSPAEFTIRLRGTDAYKKRFAANAQRVSKGLRALSEAEYIDLEDQYQNIMRQYGLPESYYTRGELGRQAGFEKFIAGDVSAAELEDRIGTAYNRVINANPEVSQALKDFYPDITNGDILAYALDPEKGLNQIKRKVTAAEIGGAARQFGLGTSAARAEELAKYGVTKQVAQEGYQAIGGGLERGRQLSQIYQQPEYTQTTAETELFGLAGAPEAGRQRRRIASMERATFGGTTGATGGALARERAGSF